MLLLLLAECGLLGFFSAAAIFLFHSERNVFAFPSWKKGEIVLIFFFFFDFECSIMILITIKMDDFLWNCEINLFRRESKIAKKSSSSPIA